MNVHVSGSTPFLFQGTILAGGTLSSAIDLQDTVLVGLISDTSAVNGTLNFQVAHSEGGTFFDLYDGEGAAVAVTLPGGTRAISGVALRFLTPYRFVKIKSSVAQTTGLRFMLPARA